MKNKGKKYIKRYGITKILIAFALIITIFLGSISYSKADAPTDYSFYTLSSVATSALSSCAGSSDSTMMDKFKLGVNPNSAGGLLGYQDTTKSTGIIGLLSAAISGSAVTYNYAQLCSGDYSTEAGVVNNVFSPYCALGACLADMGIDQTATEVSGTFGRMILGGTAYIAYTASQCVCVIFKIIIKILKLINPFQFFFKANDYITDPNAVDHTTLEITGATIKFEAITKFISTFYGQLYNLGTVVVAICFVALVVSFFMASVYGRKGGRMDALKKFLLRASFIVFGIPLLGGTYTALLDHLADDFDGGNTAAAKVIASTFCDFEGWVMSGMELPSNLIVKYKNGRVVSSDSNAVQTICYKMNQKACASLPNSLHTGIGGSSVLLIIEDAQTTDDPSSPGHSKADAHEWVIEVLGRYMTGKKIYATNYEQKWIASKWTTANKEYLAAFIEKIDTTEDIQATPNISEVWRDGNIQLDGMGGTVPNPFGKANNSSITTVDLGNSGQFTINSNLKLSPMAIYNYLNSTFDETSIKVFSSEKSSSTLIRDYHYSVSLVGKGITSIMLFLLCVTILITYAILGFVYGFGIIMTNFKRGVRLITAVPGAMLGSVQSVSKILSYTVLMILELIINIVLYGISTELLYSFAYVVASQFDNYTFSVLGYAAFSPFIRPIICFVIIIFLVWFCIQMIKLRTPIIKTLEEMSDNVIRQFVLNGAGGGSMSGSSRGGHASGNGGNGEKEMKAAGAVRAEGETKKNRTFVGRGIEKMKDTSNQEAMMGQMFGGNGSAFEEEQAFAEREKAKKAAKKNARKEKMEAGKKAVIGVGKVAVGAATGNGMLAADGGADLVKSVGMANQAAENQYQANLTADTNLAMKLNPKMAKYDDNLGYTKGQAKPVEKVTLDTLKDDVTRGMNTYIAGHEMKNAFKAKVKNNVSNAETSQKADNVVDVEYRDVSKESSSKNSMPRKTLIIVDRPNEHASAKNNEMKDIQNVESIVSKALGNEKNKF